VSFLESLGTGLRKILDKISRHPDLDETTILQTVNEIEKALIKADVNLDLVVKLGETIKKRIKQEQPPTGITKRDFLIKIIYDELVNLLGGEKHNLTGPRKIDSIQFFWWDYKVQEKRRRPQNLLSFILKRVTK
jgi:Signal recognition particle GTPase